MKRLYICLATWLLISASTAHAFLPDPSITLRQHIQCSDHIFVGEVVDVYFISNYDKPISSREAARRKHLDLGGPWIEIKLRVHEPLFSRKSKLPRIVYFQHSIPGVGYYREIDLPKGLAETLAYLKNNIGKRYIWFADAAINHKRPIIFSSYGMSQYEDLNRKATIKALIEDEKAGGKPRILRANSTKSLTFLN